MLLFFFLSFLLNTWHENNECHLHDTLLYSSSNLFCLRSTFHFGGCKQPTTTTTTVNANEFSWNTFCSRFKMTYILRKLHSHQRSTSDEPNFTGFQKPLTRQEKKKPKYSWRQWPFLLQRCKFHSTSKLHLRFLPHTHTHSHTRNDLSSF